MHPIIKRCREAIDACEQDKRRRLEAYAALAADEMLDDDDDDDRDELALKDTGRALVRLTAKEAREFYRDHAETAANADVRRALVAGIRRAKDQPVFQQACDLIHVANGCSARASGQNSPKAREESTQTPG